ncbi:hypothetical protein GF354_00535 [Candidatus Peregrinibacteria bacterium]|nr:hypothetical protein [Candidatus Peregrinibacteria bacterium]
MQKFFAKITVFLLILVYVLNLTIQTSIAAVPTIIVYEGRLLDSSNSPIATSHSIRFSLWTSADWVAGDTTAGGAVNTGAANYGGWYEVQTVTPNSNGTFSVNLGSSTSLPSIDFTNHKYLQVEVKAAADADTAYQLMDPSGDSGVDTDDRKQLGTMLYAYVADIAEGASTETFVLDEDNTIETAATGTIKLQFGTTLNKYLEYDYDNSYFDFNGNLNVQGNITVSGLVDGVDVSALGQQTASNTFTLDSDDTGGNVDLIFGTTVAEYIRHDGTLFHLSDDIRIPTDKKIELRDSAIYINSSADGQLDIDADTEVEITAPTVDLNGDLDVSGTINGTTISTTALDFQGNATIGTNADTLAIETSDWDISTTGAITGISLDADGTGNSITNIENGDIKAGAGIEFSKLASRVKKYFVTMNDLTILKDGTNNNATVYTDSETGADPHQYYEIESGQNTLQDLDLKIKVKLPEDFVDFSSTNDLSFYYKNTGTDATDSKLDILVEDDDGDDAFTAADGQGLFNTSWTEYTDEFDGGSFNPAAGEYIYITIKGYASKSGSTQQSAYAGELVLTYYGR